MTDKATGPFNGLFANTRNAQLAEIWVNEVGAGHEFSATDFADALNIARSSAVHLLNRMTEAGIMACYPHPKFSSKLLYRVAWPVTVTKPGTVPETLTAQDVLGFRYTFVVSMSLKQEGLESESFTDMEVEASSPEEAAQIARDSIRVRVSQEWEF